MTDEQQYEEERDAMDIKWDWRYGWLMCGAGAVVTFIAAEVGQIFCAIIMAYSFGFLTSMFMTRARFGERDLRRKINLRKLDESNARIDEAIKARKAARELGVK